MGQYINYLQFLRSMRVRREVLYNTNIPTQFGIFMKLDRIIKMCLNDSDTKVHIGKYVTCISYSEWSKTRICFVTIVFQFCFSICHQEGPRKSRTAIEWNTSTHDLCRC